MWSKIWCQNETPKSPETREYLGKIEIFLLLNSDFPRSKFDFLQRLSDFQEIRENLLQRLSDFFNAFLLSITAFKFSSMAFRFRETYFNGFPLSSILSKYSYREYFVFPLRTSSYFPLANCHSPHSLVSVKDMYVEMAFQLNLYRHDVVQGTQFKARLCIIAMARFCIFCDFERDITG
jgi:hypothetical protein